MYQANQFITSVAIAAGLVACGAVVAQMAKSPPKEQSAFDHRAAGKLFLANCVSCHGEHAQGKKTGCPMMQGPPLLSAVRNLSRDEFHQEVHRVAEENCCAGNLSRVKDSELDIIRAFLLDMASKDSGAAKSDASSQSSKGGQASPTEKRGSETTPRKE